MLINAILYAFVSLLQSVHSKKCFPTHNTVSTCVLKLDLIESVNIIQKIFGDTEKLSLFVGKSMHQGLMQQLNGEELAKLRIHQIQQFISFHETCLHKDAKIAFQKGNLKVSKKANVITWMIAEQNDKRSGKTKLPCLSFMFYKVDCRNAFGWSIAL